MTEFYCAHAGCEAEPGEPCFTYEWNAERGEWDKVPWPGHTHDERFAQEMLWYLDHDEPPGKGNE